MSNRRWFITFTTVFVLTMGLFGSINYVIDPFSIFESNFLKRTGQINERFLKVEFLKKNHKKFNSYMFGSSRIGVVNPKVIEQYIPDSHFYNFTLSSANLYDYMVHLKYFIEQKYEIKTLYLQIDIDDMECYGHDESDYLCKVHPSVTGESVVVGKFKYLFGFFPLNIRKKISANFKKASPKKFNREVGIWTLDSAEKELEINPRKYVKNEKSFHIKNRRIIRYTREKEVLKALETIIELCHQNNIKLYVFTSAHNHNKMDTFILEEYERFLKDISSLTSFYDFSGYNSITTNDTNYYEMSHYRPLVGKLMAARIFNDKNISVPKDFGKFIEKGHYSLD